MSESDDGYYGSSKATKRPLLALGGIVCAQTKRELLGLVGVFLLLMFSLLGIPDDGITTGHSTSRFFEIEHAKAASLVVKTATTREESAKLPTEKSDKIHDKKEPASANGMCPAGVFTLAQGQKGEESALPLTRSFCHSAGCCESPLNGPKKQCLDVARLGWSARLKQKHAREQTSDSAKKSVSLARRRKYAFVLSHIGNDYPKKLAGFESLWKSASLALSKESGGSSLDPDQFKLDLQFDIDVVLIVHFSLKEQNDDPSPPSPELFQVEGRSVVGSFQPELQEEENFDILVQDQFRTKLVSHIRLETKFRTSNSLRYGGATKDFEVEKQSLGMRNRLVEKIRHPSAIKVYKAPWRVPPGAKYNKKENWCGGQDFVRLHAFQLTQYDAVIYTDNDISFTPLLVDMFVAADFFDLFISTGGGIGEPLNVGFFAAKPSKKIFNALMKYSELANYDEKTGWGEAGWKPAGGYYVGGECGQGFWRTFFYRKDDPIVKQAYEEGGGFCLNRKFLKDDHKHGYHQGQFIYPPRAIMADRCVYNYQTSMGCGQAHRFDCRRVVAHHKPGMGVVGSDPNECQKKDLVARVDRLWRNLVQHRRVDFSYRLNTTRVERALDEQARSTEPSEIKRSLRQVLPTAAARQAEESLMDNVDLQNGPENFPILCGGKKEDGTKNTVTASVLRQGDRLVLPPVELSDNLSKRKILAITSLLPDSLKLYTDTPWAKTILKANIKHLHARGHGLVVRTKLTPVLKDIVLRKGESELHDKTPLTGWEVKMCEKEYSTANQVELLIKCQKRFERENANWEKHLMLADYLGKALLENSRSIFANVTHIAMLDADVLLTDRFDALAEGAAMLEGERQLLMGNEDWILDPNDGAKFKRANGGFILVKVTEAMRNLFRDLFDAHVGVGEQLKHPELESTASKVANRYQALKTWRTEGISDRWCDSNEMLCINEIVGIGPVANKFILLSGKKWNAGYNFRAWEETSQGKKSGAMLDVRVMHYMGGQGKAAVKDLCGENSVPYFDALGEKWRKYTDACGEGRIVKMPQAKEGECKQLDNPTGWEIPALWELSWKPLVQPEVTTSDENEVVQAEILRVAERSDEEPKSKKEDQREDDNLLASLPSINVSSEVRLSYKCCDKRVSKDDTEALHSNWECCGEEGFIVKKDVRPEVGDRRGVDYGFYIHIGMKSEVHAVYYLYHRIRILFGKSAPVYIMSDGVSGVGFEKLCSSGDSLCKYRSCPPAEDRWHPWPFFRRMHDAGKWIGNVSGSIKYLIYLEPDNTLHNPMGNEPTQHYLVEPPVLGKGPHTGSEIYAHAGGVKDNNGLFSDSVVAFVEKERQKYYGNVKDLPKKWLGYKGTGLCGGSWFSLEAVREAFSDEALAKIDWVGIVKRFSKDVYSSDFAMPIALAYRGYGYQPWKRVRQAHGTEFFTRKAVENGLYRGQPVQGVAIIHYNRDIKGGKPGSRLFVPGVAEMLAVEDTKGFNNKMPTCQMCWNMDEYKKRWFHDGVDVKSEEFCAAGFDWDYPVGSVAGDMESGPAAAVKRMR